MQYNVCPAASTATSSRIANVSLQKPKLPALICSDFGTHIFHILRVAGGQIVQTYNALIKSQQRLHQV